MRSHNYQHIFYEVFTANENLVHFSNEDSYSQNRNQVVLELQDKLYRRVLKLAPLILTKKQYIVFKMYYIQSLSTPTIGKQLGENIGSVRNQLKGLKNNKGNGGVLPKLKNSLLKDKVCLNILKEIESLS